MFGTRPGDGPRGFMQSPPCVVHLAGWKSDTYTLATSGWAVSMAQDIRRQCINIAIKHEGMGCIAYGDALDFNYMARMQGDDRRPEFVCRKFLSDQSRVELHRASFNPFADFQPVDCVPRMVLTSEVKKLEDLILFAPAQPVEKAIIVEEKDVLSLLEDIKRIQAPAQAELREKMRRATPAEMRTTTHHAQIISINRAA